MWRKNIPGGSDGTDEDFQKRARASEWVLRATAVAGRFNYVWASKNDLQFRANLVRSNTRDALVAPEQFGIGGADSIRGFNERYASNDRGIGLH